jgi:hypothetical protein
MNRFEKVWFMVGDVTTLREKARRDEMWGNVAEAGTRVKVIGYGEGCQLLPNIVSKSLW